jgi:hypothetical protein
MSTLRVSTLQDVAGTGQPAMSGAAKAWVNFNGTGTVAIRQQFNVSSITDNGTGDYTLNFTSSISTNYAVVGTCQFGSSFGAYVNAPYLGVTSGTSVRLLTASTATAYDTTYVSVAIFR